MSRIASAALVDAAIRRALRLPSTRVFEAVREFPGFQNRLRQSVMELASHSIPPDRLEAAATSTKSIAFGSVYRFAWNTAGSLGLSLAPPLAPLTPRQHSLAERIKVAAPSRSREAQEITRRILALHGPSEALVVLREWEPYGPLLEAAFHRFGVPARFHFDFPLEHQPAVRRWLARVESSESGWRLPENWDDCRRILRVTPAPRLSAAADPPAVDVIAAAESLQWSKPQVFVCGLIEGEFPQPPRADPILDETLRAELGLPSVEVRRQEELALPWQAIACATVRATITWPILDAKGELTAPARMMEEIAGEPETAVPIRPAVAPLERPVAQSSALETQAPAFAAGRSWRPTEIETYLSCPFKYFARHWLRLEPLPKRPEDRFDFREQGKLVHDLLRDVQSPDGFAELYARAFTALRQELKLPDTHRTEFLRLAIYRDLRDYLADPYQLGGLSTEAEWPFEFELIPGLTIRGRIDRFDRADDGSVHAVDYKYSAAARVKQRARSDASVQGGLYLLALQRAGYRPLSFAYVGVKKGKEVIRDLAPEETMRSARERTIESVTAISAGAFPVRPANREDCRWCEFLDTCRIREAADQRGTATA